MLYYDQVIEEHNWPCAFQLQRVGDQYQLRPEDDQFYARS